MNYKQIKIKHMKKVMMALCTLALCMGFVACSSNDDEEKSVAEKVVGTYIGQTSTAFQYSPAPLVTQDDSIVVVKGANNTVNIEFRSKRWGKAVFTNAQVAESTTGYTFAETTGNIAVPSERQAGLIMNYTCKLNGSISKNSKNETNFTIVIQGLMGGTTMTFTSKAN